MYTHLVLVSDHDDSDAEAFLADDDIHRAVIAVLRFIEHNRIVLLAQVSPRQLKLLHYTRVLHWQTPETVTLLHLPPGTVCLAQHPAVFRERRRFFPSLRWVWELNAFDVMGANMSVLRSPESGQRPQYNPSIAIADL